MRKSILVLSIFYLLNINTTAQNGERDEALIAKAKELAGKFIIVDTHVDLPLRLRGKDIDITKKSSEGEMDYLRAVEGGLDAPFMSIYIPSRLEESEAADKYAEELISVVEELVQKHPEKFALAKTSSDIVANFANKKISLPMGMENGSPINGSIDKLEYYYDRGIRYVTLTHAKANHISDSSYDENRKWNGLSPFGKLLIKEMNNIGMIIDVSHVTDSAFYQVIALSKAPVIASHSSCRFFTPGYERNISDEMIVKLAENGGVVHINFGSFFLNEGVKKRGEEYEEIVKKFLTENNLDRNSDSVRVFSKKYKEEHPIGYADITEVVDHIDHVVELVGINYVGLGSDFEGVGDALPTGLKDVSMYPNLIYELLKRGYSEDDVEKICSLNF
ncbi:MAG: dipeptidase, partial [Bacteroidetes bacterium]|nr:dipeptidase [Bacteroidota bacterium]